MRLPEMSRGQQEAGWIAVVLLGLGLRLWHLGAASLWNDELFTRFYVDTGLRALWTSGFAIETTPPTYYTVMLGWTRLFGTTEAALRLPSVIASMLTLPLVGLLGRSLGGPACGLAAAAVWAVAPMEVFYAQEARAYAFMLPPVALMLLCMARLSRRLDPHDPARARPSSTGPSSTGPSSTGPSSAGPWQAALAGYILTASLAIYVHTTAVLIVAACGAVGALSLAWTRPQGWRRDVVFWATAQAAVVALCTPQLLAMAGQVQANRLSWMQPTRLWDVRAALAILVTGPAATPLWLQTALALLLAACLAAALALHRPDRRAATLLIALPLLDFALIVGSSLRQPILVPRLLCWMWIPLSVLLAQAITRPGRLRAPAAGVVGLVLAVGLGFQLSQDATAKEPWRLLIHRIEPWLDAADLVVTGPWTQPMGLAYYGAAAGTRAHWTENQPATIENTTIHRMLGVPEISRAALLDAIRAGRRVVLIQRSVESQFLTVLNAPPPSRSLTQRCWATGPCLAALAWGPTPPPR